MRSHGFLTLAALATLAGPALADAGSEPARRAHHGGWSGHGRPQAVAPHHHRRHHTWDRRLRAGPSAGLVGPTFYAWPDPASVRVPIYNRPLDQPFYD